MIEVLSYFFGNFPRGSPFVNGKTSLAEKVENGVKTCRQNDPQNFFFQSLKFTAGVPSLEISTKECNFNFVSFGGH